jgi:DNA-binding winged helix-turn-helix (wHTH) protein
MNSFPSERVRFGAFELDLTTGELRSTEAPDPDDPRPDNKVLLREQVFQVLRMLVEREGKIVTREEIKSRLWANDTVVDFDRSINATIKTLRRALGDSADSSRYIETLGRRGYRLMPAVEYLESAPGTEPGEVTAEVHPIRVRGRLGRELAAGALLVVSALSLWRYEVYRHRITLGKMPTTMFPSIAKPRPSTRS